MAPGRSATRSDALLFAVMAGPRPGHPPAHGDGGSSPAHDATACDNEDFVNTQRPGRAQTRPSPGVAQLRRTSRWVNFECFSRGFMACVIGIDGGTESLRAFVFDLDGRPLGSAATAYKTDFPQPGWAEQSPHDWWSAAGQSVRGATAKAGVSAGDVLAICADTTCCSVVALDAKRRAPASGDDLDGRALGCGKRARWRQPEIRSCGSTATARARYRPNG